MQEIFIVTSRSRADGTERVVACYKDKALALRRAKEEEVEWEREGWSSREIPSYYVDRHFLVD